MNLSHSFTRYSAEDPALRVSKNSFEKQVMNKKPKRTKILLNEDLKLRMQSKKMMMNMFQSSA